MNNRRPTDLGRVVRRFFEEYLPNLRGLSTHTIKSYRDALVLFLCFASSDARCPIERLDITDLDRERVMRFLAHLEAVRRNSIATRNARLAALHTFARFLATERPEHLATLQAVLGIPFKRGAREAPIAEALPDRVQGDTANMNVFSVQGRSPAGRSVTSLFFLAGGLGAMRGLDGRDATPSPSNMTVVPTEVWENLTGIAVERRSLLPDSGEPGEWRGGASQEVVFRNDTPELLDLALMGQRTRFAAKGFFGGGDGGLRVYLRDGTPVDPKGRHLLAPGERIVMREAGGGGYGDPRRRDPAHVLADVRAGRVSVEGVRRDYGVEVDVARGGGAPRGLSRPRVALLDDRGALERVPPPEPRAVVDRARDALGERLPTGGARVCLG